MFFLPQLYQFIQIYAELRTCHLDIFHNTDFLNFASFGISWYRFSIECRKSVVNSNQFTTPVFCAADEQFPVAENRSPASHFEHLRSQHGYTY